MVALASHKRPAHITSPGAAAGSSQSPHLLVLRVLHPAVEILGRQQQPRLIDPLVLWAAVGGLTLSDVSVLR